MQEPQGRAQLWARDIIMVTSRWWTVRNMLHHVMRSGAGLSAGER